MAELKPCPFCGATEQTGMVQDCIVPVESFLRKETVEFFSVKCFCCGCKIGNHNTKDGAITAWNRRADANSLTEALKRNTNQIEEKSNGILAEYFRHLQEKNKELDEELASIFASREEAVNLWNRRVEEDG